MPMITKPSRSEKHGDEKLRADVKSGLNKLSDDTFDAIVPELLQSIRLLGSTGADLIMATAAENKFYARLYAKLFVKCSANLLMERVAAHKEAVLAGELNCRAFTSFLVELTLEKGLEDEVLRDLAASFQDKLEDGMNDASAKSRNEELAEHVIELARWLPKARMAAMAQRQPKDFTGITFKVMFKYLDYQEKNTQKKNTP